MHLRRQRQEAFSPGRRHRIRAAVTPLVLAADTWSKDFVKELSTHRAFSYYMIFSYLYYCHDISPISDSLYDLLCKKLAKVWGSITHPHKDYATLEDMEAGTAYTITQYPFLVRGAARQWLQLNSPDMLKELRIGI